MAFVYRAPRQTLTNPNVNTDIGPGLYISPDFQSSVKPKEPGKIPFQSSVFRDMKLRKNESAVGPGYYYKDNRHENFLKMIHKDTEKKKNPLYRSIDADKQTPFGFYLAEDLRQKYGFLSKDRRFRNTSFDEGPGPGAYNLAENVGNKEKSPATTSRVKPSKNLVESALMELVGSPKRITSIPSRVNSYGYEVKGETVVKMNRNPEGERFLSGDKGDSAGPGQYDIVSPDYWLKKKGTQWSKYKTGRSQTITTKSTAANTNIEDFEFSNEKRIKEELNKEQKKLEKLKLHKLFKEQGRRRRSLANEFHGSPNTSLLEKLAKQDSPGPGYYIDIYEHSAFKRDPVPEKLQKFGSGSQRFIPEHITIENSVGPGSYFLEDVHSKKVQQINQRLNKSPPFLSSEKRSNAIVKASAELSPGPASYNPEKNINTKAVSSKCIFGSSEIRLPEKAKELAPGPGSYIPLNKWNKITTNDVLKMMKPKFQENNKIVEEKDKISDIPPVGTYNADIISSLSYQIEKKNSKFNAINAPFMSVNKRFRYKTANDNIGPGSYELEEKLAKVKDKEFHPPFCASDNRFKDNKNITLNGPGLYNQDSYFNWNKKSYNILYYS